MTNPYSVLGVSQTASEDEIKQAYRKLAKQHHPDRGGDEEKFKAVNEAYDNIKNPQPKQPEYPQGFGPDGFQGMGGFEDLFRQHFNFTQRTPRNADVLITYYITLEELISNANKDIEIRHQGGTRTVSISVPAGIYDGVEVKYTGFGQDNLPGPPGNLVVLYRIKKHPEFTVDEFNLVKRLNISIREAMLGTDKIITTLDNRSIKLTIKPGTQSRSRLRIPESGLPRRGKPNGNLYIEVLVNIPELTKEDLNKPLKDVI